jgi:hypothetical protein
MQVIQSKQNAPNNIPSPSPLTDGLLLQGDMHRHPSGLAGVPQQTENRHKNRLVVHTHKHNWHKSTTAGSCHLSLRLEQGLPYHWFGNRPYRPGPDGYQPMGKKFFEFEFQKLKNVRKNP